MKLLRTNNIEIIVKVSQSYFWYIAYVLRNRIQKFEQKFSLRAELVIVHILTRLFGRVCTICINQHYEVSKIFESGVINAFSTTVHVQKRDVETNDYIVPVPFSAIAAITAKFHISRRRGKKMGYPA